MATNRRPTRRHLPLRARFDVRRQAPTASLEQPLNGTRFKRLKPAVYPCATQIRLVPPFLKFFFSPPSTPHIEQDALRHRPQDQAGLQRQALKLLDEHERAFLVHADNVGSRQFMDIRSVRFVPAETPLTTRPSLPFF